MKFLKKLSLKKLLYDKRFTITLSILSAFVIWIVITVQQKPVIQRTFTDLTVNINLENTFASENGINIIGDISEQKFTVVVTGPTSVVSSLTTNDISLYASAGEVDAPGTYNLKVSPTSSVASAEYEVTSISPPAIDVNFDYVETEEFSISAIAEGVTPADGLIAESGTVGGTEKDTVTITGPRTIISQIETVSAVAKVNKTLSATESFDADIVLFNAEGNVIDQKNLNLSVSKVQVTVPISKKKTVPVKVDFSNAPSGFDVASLDISYNYSTVTIIGTPDKVEKTTQILLSPIDLSSLSVGKKNFDVSLKLPEGVRLLDTIEFITVTINSSNYTEKTIDVNAVKYTGLSTGLSTGSLSGIKNVKICGPRNIIRNFNADNITAEVDLTDKKAGQHTVTVKFKLNDHKNVWVVGQYSTTVTIK